jgi:cysteinyl-tRNA synthetase
MALRIHDTLTQKTSEFVPSTPGQVKMYVCGPTVYGFLHVGNFRGPIFFNLVRNWLEKGHGYKVTYVYNYTDVDDKIINRAIEEKVESSEISEKYIAEFEKDFATLKLRKHDKNPRVTEYMQPIRDMIAQLIDRKVAYVAQDGEVLYSVRNFKEYGKLSHKKIDDLESGARVEVSQKKQDPLDFALWKPAKPGEPKWESPWSEGRPGWHIECSAMIHSILGETIDIHGGGMDLVFPHHENEIAQTEGATGKQFVKYWMHNNMLTFGDKKMSKSLGNIVTGRDFLTKYNGEILKFMILSVHYRSLSDFSEKAIENAITGLARVYSSLALAEKALVGAGLTPEQSAALAAGKSQIPVAKALATVLEDGRKKITEALDDDFNTPEVFAEIYKAVRAFNNSYRYGQKVTQEVAASATALVMWIREWGQLMSLFQEPPAAFLQTLDDMLLEQMGLERSKVDSLVAERTAARAAKDFAKSDELRNKLAEMKIALHDTPSGTHWEVQK